MFQFKALRFLRECAYKRGRPIPRQSILGVWSQPAGDMQDRMCLWNISGASQQEAVSWRRAVAVEGSTLSNLLSGSKVKVWISLLQG